MNTRVNRHLTAWEPGARGKGVLIHDDPRRLEIWKVDDFGYPHHADGLLALGLDVTSNDVCFVIDDAGLTTYQAENIDGRSPGAVIRELDPRVPLDAEPGPWEFG